MMSTRRTPTRMHAALLGALALLACGLGPGCASPDVTLEVTSRPQTNAGRPLYVVLRSVDPADFASESYDSIARRVFARPRDESILGSQVIFPGVDAEVVIQKPERYPLAIYFLFTDPGDRWKRSVSQPLPDHVEVELGEREIAN